MNLINTVSRHPPTMNPNFKREKNIIAPGSLTQSGKPRNMFKSGADNKKIGGWVMVKHWQGMPIYSLTLEERATCPANCEQWEICYGNNMPYAHRFDHTHPDFYAEIEKEINILSIRHPHGFLVRLHVLGDFVHQKYVDFWAGLIRKHEELHIYGYTHHRASSPIGNSIADLNRHNHGRFRIRFSDEAREVFATRTIKTKEEAKENEVLCPEQAGLTESCGTCGLCWSQPLKTIAFLEH